MANKYYVTVEITRSLFSMYPEKGEYTEVCKTKEDLNRCIERIGKNNQKVLRIVEGKEVAFENKIVIKDYYADDEVDSDLLDMFEQDATSTLQPIADAAAKVIEEEDVPLT